MQSVALVAVGESGNPAQVPGREGSPLEGAPHTESSPWFAPTCIPQATSETRRPKTTNPLERERGRRKKRKVGKKNLTRVRGSEGSGQ